VDFQFGGVDQRKIFVFAEEVLPKLGYKKRAHLMNRMVPGLAGGKMSSSDPNSKIDFLDSPADIKKKIKAAFCEEGNVEDNGILAFAKAVLIPISRLRQAIIASGAPDDGGVKPFVLEGAPEGTVFSISRKEEWGGPLHYSSYEQLEQDFAERKLHPGDLKAGVQEAITNLLAPLHRMFAEDEEFRQAEARAYPPPEPVKKVKKEKKQGIRPPGKTGTLATDAERTAEGQNGINDAPGEGETEEIVKKVEEVRLTNPTA